MKKFKLLALAVMAMLGTNAMAVDVTTNGNSGTTVFTFAWEQKADGETIKSRTAVINSFVSGLTDEQKAAVLIPDSVTDGLTGIKYAVVGIAAGAFKNQPISTISFFAKTYAADGTTLVKGITSIGAGAFEGTNITTLDLSNTAITDVENLFGTTIAAAAKDDKKNTKLTSVTLPGTWTTIKDKAFENCTALATVNFGTATAANQAFEAGKANFFAGCPITALDFTGTKVTTVPATLLMDGTRYKSNANLLTVTLTDKFAASDDGLNCAFKGCTALTTVSNLEKTALTKLKASEFEGDAALATINTSKIAVFNASVFKGCAALTSVNLDAATTIDESAFESAGLTSVTFPKSGLTTIGKNAFWECAALATVTFNVDATTKKTAITTIKEGAFGYTGIASFTLPAANTEGFTIETKAFVGCENLTEFTYAPTEVAGADAAAKTANAHKIEGTAFNRCSDVAFHTTAAFATAWRSGTDYANEGDKYYNGPTNTTIDYDTSAKTTALTTTAYKSNASKYYVKWMGQAGSPLANTPIKVKKDEAKVYAAYVDHDDQSINMVKYGAENGYVYIKQGAVALIITEKQDLAYEAGTTDKTTSFISNETAAGTYTVGTEGMTYNALRYVTTATTRAKLESAVADGYNLYGWVNTASNCGFQKITSGSAIPAGTLFIWAKTPASGRITINWYDENGNLENQTTGIESIGAAEAVEEGAVYNLQGIRVNGNQKGIFIKNGKKFIVK